MADLAPFAPVRAPGNPMCSFALSRVATPPLSCTACTHLLEIFTMKKNVLQNVLRMQSGAPLQLAAPNPMATPVAQLALWMLVVCQGRNWAQEAPNTRLWQEHRPCCSWCTSACACHCAVLGWHTLNQHLIYIAVACYEPTCIYGSIWICLTYSCVMHAHNSHVHVNSMQKMQ